MIKGKLKPGWATVAFGDVVKLNKDRSKDPAADGIERYVGLEHIEPENLRIREWGLVSNGTTFTQKFRSGHVLFGKRRAYQRKVAVADFEGICSGDIYVFEPKNSKLIPELLPFICQTEAFYDFAVGTSAGSLSPRTNWKQLAEFEFALPPLDEQRRIAEVLWAAETSLREYENLKERAWRLHQGYVEEYFSRGAGQKCYEKTKPSHMQSGWQWLPIDDLCSHVVDCLHRTPQYSEDGFPAIRTADLKPGILSIQGALRVSEDEYLTQIGRLKPISKDVLFSREGERLGMAALVPQSPPVCISQRMMHFRTQSDYPAELLMELLNSNWIQRQIKMCISGSTSPHVNVQEIKKFMVPVPPTSERQIFASRSTALLNSYITVESRVNVIKKRNLYLLSTVVGGE